MKILLRTMNMTLTGAKKRKTKFENYVLEADRKLSNMTEVVNKIMIALQTNLTTSCRTNKASLALDISELTNILKFTNLQRQIEIEKEDVLKSMRRLEDNTGCFPGLQNSTTTGAKCDWVREERIEKIEGKKSSLKLGFSDIDNEARDCQIDKAFLMPHENLTYQCETEGLNFFQRCNLEHETFFGNCMTTKNQTVVTDTGELAGHYISVGGNEFQCYGACKEVSGARGCQYRRTNCHGSDITCKGDCFVFTEELRYMDNSIHASTCRRFKSPSPGYGQTGNT